MTALEKWKNDFKEFISELSISRDDYKGIMGYINEVPNEALEQKPCEDVVKKDCGNCAYYDNGANDEACNGCFENEEHLNFKPKTQYCDDCISRQEAINCVTSNEFRYKIVEDIKTLPSVTPKEKTGHWIKYSIPRCGEQHYLCTSCGYYINFGQWGEVYTKQFKYCPLCSAKMIEPQESEVNET